MQTTANRPVPRHPHFMHPARVFKGLSAATILASITFAGSGGVFAETPLQPAATLNQKAQVKTAHASYGNLPLSFEPNRGQSDPSVRFVSRGPGYAILLKDRGAVLSFSSGRPATETAAGKKHAGSHASNMVEMQVVGGNSQAAVTGDEKLPGTANYLIGSDPGKWKTNLPTYARVNYSQVYPGIDLKYYGNQKQLEFDFALAPGADYHQIQVHFSDAKLAIHANGDLSIRSSDREVSFRRPYLYQERNGQRKPVQGSFVLAKNRTVGFKVGTYDHSQPLIIDPVLAYSTYLGGSGYHVPAGPDCCGDVGTAITADATGSAYVTGYTGSADFPITSGAYQTTNADASRNGAAVPFVSKFTADGSALVYSTYFGGSGDYWYGDEASAIAVDSSGDAYITGYTSSSNFPTTTGAYQTTNKTYANIARTAFITKLSPDGSKPVYSTYVGGSGFNNGVARDGEYATGIAVDAEGDAYISGTTFSKDFPVTNGAIQSTNQATAILGSNLFVTKMNAAGSALIYSTYLGGTGVATKDFSGADYGGGIAVDTAGDAYVTGYAHSENFPITSGAFQMTNNADTSLNGTGASNINAIVSKLNPTGTQLLYSTYLGGSGNPYYGDTGVGIAVDADGEAFVTGRAASPNFPTTSGSFHPIAGSWTASYLYAGYITKLNSAGSALVYSTFLGGSPQGGAAKRGEGDTTTAIAIDASGDAYVTGVTYAADFPVTADAFQGTNNQSTDGPADYYSGNAFMTALSPDGSALLYSTYLGGAGAPSGGGGDIGLGIAVDISDNVYLTGYTLSSNFPVTAEAFQTTNNAVNAGNPGTTNAFVSKFGPSAGVSQQITFGSLSGVTYGAAPITLSATSSSGLPVSYTATGPAKVNGSVLTITGAGSVKVTASQNGNGVYSAAPTVTQSFTVSPAVLTVTANPLPGTNAITVGYGNYAPTWTDFESITGFVNGDTASVVGGFPTFTPGWGSSPDVGAYSLTIGVGSLSSANYTFTTVNSTVNVTPAVLTIKPESANMKYGGTLPVLSYVVTGLKYGQSASSVITGTLSVSTTATSTSTVGQYAVSLQVSGLSAKNYTFAVGPNAVLTVEPVKVQVKALGISIPFDAAIPSFQYAFSGFVNGDTAGVVTGAPVITTTAAQGSQPGTYPISVAIGTLSAKNYIFDAGPNATLTIRKQ